jgi:hypothetical protein
MKGIFRLVLLGCLISSPCSAQDRNEVIMKTIYSKIEAILGVSDPSSPVQHAGLVLAAPGFVLDENVNFNTVAGRGLIYSVIDHSIQPNWFLRWSQYTTSGLYNHILNDREYAPSQLSDADKVRLEAAKKSLYKNKVKGDPSVEYAKYQDLQSAYYTAQDTYTSQVNASADHNPTNAQSLALQKAHDAFFNYPFYGEIVGAIDDEQTLSLKDPAVYWGNLRALYNRNLVPSGTGAGNMIASYSFYPTYQGWLDKSLQWTTITITDADEATTQISSHTSWGGGLGAGWGPWRVNANYGQSEGSTLKGFDAKHYNLTFDVLRVLIFRPWMDPTVYGSPTWRWNQKSTQKELISTGDLSNATPAGVQPFIAQELLLARNVKLAGDWTSDLKTTYHSERSGGGSVGWGPFSFGGSYSSTYDESKDHNQVSTNGIVSPSVQIIGMLVDVLPKTPNGDDSLFGNPVVFPTTENFTFLNGKARDNRYDEVYKSLKLNP